MQPHFVNFATSTPKRIIKVSILTKKGYYNSLDQTRNKIDMS